MRALALALMLAGCAAPEPEPQITEEETYRQIAQDMAEIQKIMLEAQARQEEIDRLLRGEK